jgi:hypothetical protein
MPADLAFALRDDCRVYDAAQVVTHVSKSESDGDVNTTVDFAASKVFTDQQVANGGGYIQKGDVSWLLFDQYMNADVRRKPKDGDSIIEEDGTEWKILSASRDSVKQAWDCQCTRAR